MNPLFTVAQTGLDANPMAACFGFFLLGGVVFIGIAALIAGLLRWRRPNAIPPVILRILGVISSVVAILSLSYDFFGFEQAAPAWIISLSAPALAGGLFALFWSSSNGRRTLFFVFAGLTMAVVLGGLGKALLTSHRHNQLVRAAEKGDTVTVMRAIGDGADVETTGDCTLLGLAVAAGHPETVRALLRAGANPNHWKCNILEMAVQRRDKEIVRVLLTAGADSAGYGALIDEARREGSEDIARMLEDAGRAR